MQAGLTLCWAHKHLPNCWVNHVAAEIVSEHGCFCCEYFNTINCLANVKNKNTISVLFCSRDESLSLDLFSYTAISQTSNPYKPDPFLVGHRQLVQTRIGCCRSQLFAT